MHADGMLNGGIAHPTDQYPQGRIGMGGALAWSAHLDTAFTIGVMFPKKKLDPFCRGAATTSVGNMAPSVLQDSDRHTSEALLARFGLIVGGADLVRLLGYRSASAFRMAAHRGTLGVPTFFVRGRRGRCARTSDVVRWAVRLCEPDHPPSLRR